MKRPVPYLVFTLVVLSVSHLAVQAHNTGYISNKNNVGTSLEVPGYPDVWEPVSMDTPGEILVDNTQPVVLSVGVPGNGTYKKGQNLDFIVNMSEATYMRVGGSAFVIVTLDTGGEIHPVYVSGSGTTALTFRYTLEEGQQDLTGISVGSSIYTNSGDLTNAAGNNAVTSLNNVAGTTNVLVDAIKPVVSSLSVPAGFYRVGANLDITVNMSEASVVNTENGTPYLNVITDIGDPVHAGYLSGSGTSALTFRYTVVSGDKASWGIGITAGSYLAANGGVITDIAGNNASLYLNGGWFNNVRVDTSNPTVISVAVPNNWTYKVGQNLDFSVYLSEAVTVSGTPCLEVTLDTGGTVHAAYLSGSGTSTLTFRYTIVSGNLDLTGITLGASVIANGGTLSDVAGNNTDLTLNGINNTAGILVDGVGPVVTSVEVPADSTYAAGQTLWFNVNFNESTIAGVAGGWPSFNLTFDTGGTVQARYERRSGSVLTFKYVISSGLLDTNGIVLGTSIVLNGGTIYDNYSNQASLGLTNIGSTLNVRVDAIAPTVTSVSVPANGTYTAGQNLDFTLNMSKATTVNLTGGTPYLNVTLDTGGTVQAAYQSGSGTSALVFRYTVVSGNRDQTGIVLNSMMPNGSTLKDAVGNNADLTLNNIGSTLNVRVDAIAPTVSSVGVPANGTYVAGQNLDFTVHMSEATAVDLTGGTPCLNVTLDTGGTVQATYLSGGGSTSLVFRYTVVSGNLDQTGIAVVSPMVLNGATLKDAAGNNAVLTLNSIGSTANVNVDAVAPTVNAVGVPANGTYSTGQNLDFTVNMSETTFVNATGGTPYLEIVLDTGGTVHAAYQSGSGTSALVYRYSVVSGNLDATGVTPGGVITANGGTLKDAAGNNANLTLNGVGSTTSILVDGVAPTVSSVSVPVDGTYIMGQNLDFTVNLSEAVIVNTSSGIPYVGVSLDTGGTVQAAYLSGSGTSALSFRYTLPSGKLDPTGIVVAGSMTINGGTIKDAAGNNAILTLNNVGGTSNVLVDAVAPTVSSVSVPANGTYVAGQNLDFTVNMSEATTVNTTGGTPYLNVTMDTGGTVQAAYLSGSGTTSLVFRYTVVSGNLDVNGIALSASLAANGSTLKDAAGNNAVLTLNGVGSTANVRVDAVEPATISVNVPVNGTYKTGQNLDFTVNMSEATTVNTSGGTPYLDVAMDTGGTVHASYLEGSETASLTFRYTVVSGNRDATGIVVGALMANGGSLRDAAGNDAVLTLNSVANTANVMVDGVAPVVSSVTSANANGTFRIGDVIPVTVTFSEAVDVTGTPALAFNSGGSASYSSGNGTSTLTFSYTVGSGHSSADLDYASTGSLSLSGGTIRDLPGNDAVLALPAPGGVNSLGGQKNLVVDGIQPAIVSVSSGNANGNYLTGDHVVITVTFSETVTVTGTPVLALNSGGIANYGSGSATNVLSFSYTVVDGQNSADLDYSSTSALSLSGGTIKDNAGNDAQLTLPAVGDVGSLGANKNLVIGVLPCLTTQAVTHMGATTASAAGTLTVLGFPNPTSYGVCWSTSPSPTVMNSMVDLGATASTGSFPASVTGLSQGTVYYLRAYATNNVGTGYGNEVTFRTLKQLTITAPTIHSKNYNGNTVAAVDQLGTLSGIIGGEEVGVTAVASFDNKNAGTGKTVTVTYTLTGADRENYIVPVNSVVNTGVILPFQVAITPSGGQSKIYGDADPAFDYSFTPSLLPGDYLSGTLSRTSGENAGLYSISLGDLTAGSNYALQMTSDVSFSILKAPLTITAEAKTKSFGAVNPPLTVQYRGWKNSDQEVALRSKPHLSTSVNQASPAGEYPNSITISGAAGENYDITCFPASFSVVKAVLTVRADPATKVYGESNPSLSFVYSGWVNSDNETSLSGRPVANTSVTNATVAGLYHGVITLSGGEDENYSFNYVAADFTISPRQVTPVVTARNKCYDANSVAALSSTTLTGIIAPDEVYLVAGNAFFSDPAAGSDKTVTAGNLSLSGANAANYILTQSTVNTKAGIYSIPFSVLSGPAQICAGAAPAEYWIDSSMVSCQWTVSPGGVIASGQGTSRITVAWTVPGQQNIAVTYSNANGCASGEASKMKVTVNPQVVPHIYGPSALCAGTKGVTYMTEEGMSNYRWSISPGGTILSGSGTNVVVVDWNSGGAQSLGVTYSNASGCTTTQPVFYPVTVAALPTPTISGTMDLCASSAGNVYTTDAGKNDYLWSVSPGGIITSGAQSGTATVTWVTAGVHHISVTYANNEGCQPSEPVQQMVTVRPLPAAPAAIQGETNPCASSQGVNYSILPVANASAYVWTLPTGATIASGAGTTAIKVNFGATAGLGTISVYATNNCGNSAPATLTIMTKPLVANAGAITGPAAVCQGTSALRFTVSPLANATTYTWNLPAGYTITEGDGSNSIVINLEMYAASGTITVSGANECGKGAVSPPFPLRVNPIPPDAFISVSGTTLISDAPQGNQWYFSATGNGPGSAVPGATASTFTPTMDGWYWTRVTLADCSSGQSNKLYRINPSGHNQYRLYPVPNHGEFTISVVTPYEEEVSLIICDMSGHKIYELTGLHINGEFKKDINLRQLQSGFYNLLILSKEGRATMKFNIVR